MLNKVWRIFNYKNFNISQIIFNAAEIHPFFKQYLRTERYSIRITYVATYLYKIQKLKKNHKRIFFENTTSPPNAVCKVAHASCVAEATLMTED